MAVSRLVVVGTSAGGVDALKTLVRSLPADFPAALCIVMHVAPESPMLLPDILMGAGSLPAKTAATGTKLENGHIYIAPPDHHLLVEPGTLRLTRGPKENGSRPAVDPLFRSAAQIYGPAAVGVVLTGNLDDGTSGLWTVKQLGGIAIVQDPADALYPSMPTSAAQQVNVDYCLPLSAIGPLLVRLVGAPIDGGQHLHAPRQLEIEMKIANGINAVEAGIEHLGPPSSFACPECHGVLRHVQEPVTRFRCHTGHAYALQHLIAAINEGIEEAIWSAARALEEKALLFEQLAVALGEADRESAAQMRERARTVRAQSNAVRGAALDEQDADAL